MNSILQRLKTTTVLLGILLLPLTAAGQDFSRDQKISREEKKEARQAHLYQNFRAIDTLLERRTFVLEANYLQNRYGDQVPVSSLINFIKVEKPSVVLQTGSNAISGSNGVGGVTAEGTISNWKVTKNEKRLNYTVFFSTVTNIGTYDILLRIGADASATATITGMTRGSITYRGNLVAPYNSRVFKGQRSM
jgi:hypothetical protein